MKITTGILGCALVAGLMTFAATNIQANNSASKDNIVIDNTLYSPIDLKVTVKYVDGDKIKQTTATSKDLLNDLGFDTKQVKLCLGEDGNVYVVNKKNGDVVNISVEEGNGMLISTTEQLQVSKFSGNNDQNAQYQSEGQIEVKFFGDSADFDMFGLYSAKLNTNENSNNSTQKIKTSAKTMSLSGTANVLDLGDNLPASGTGNGNGNGTVDILL